MPKTTYVVLLNWNGWQDTVACLESLFASRGVKFRVIVCDNASSDQSLQRIAAWSRGELHAEIPIQPRLARLVRQDARRPRCTVLSRARAERGGDSTDGELVLINNQANLGFAGGNNVGLRYAMLQPDMDAVWLLNNDTLVEPDCLAAMRQQLASEGDRAVCGSVIHFFDRPGTIQAIGGNPFDSKTGIAGQSLGRYLDESEVDDVERWTRDVDYLSGCSLMWPRAALHEVGLLNENYFLYYEEIDWFTRNRRRFPTVIAGNARLYHREGSAIGSPTAGRRASRLSDFHMFRSRALFMRAYYPENSRSLLTGVMRDIAKRFLNGQARSVTTIVRAIHSVWHG